MGTHSALSFKLQSALGVAAFVAAGAVFAQSSDAVPRAPDGRPDLSGTWDNGAGMSGSWTGTRCN